MVQQALKIAKGQLIWARIAEILRCCLSTCKSEIVSAVTDGDGLARYLEHVGMGRDPPRVWGVRAAALVFGEEF